MKKTKVYVSIPSVGTVVDMIPYALRQYEKEYADSIEFVYPQNLVQRRFHDFARNMAVEDFLKTDADVLWFWDSDIVPPPNAPDLITKHSPLWELAGCSYPVFMTAGEEKEPSVVLCVYTRDETGLHARSVPYSGMAMVDGMATGCLFIKREVLEKMSAPYFEFKFDPKTRFMTEGEDLGFCLKVNDLGYKFFTDFSMVCKHYKTVDLLDVNNYAILYAQKAVASYDAEIRPQVEKLAAQLQEARRGKTKSGLILPP